MWMSTGADLSLLWLCQFFASIASAVACFLDLSGFFVSLWSIGSSLLLRISYLELLAILRIFLIVNLKNSII